MLAEDMRLTENVQSALDCSVGMGSRSLKLLVQVRGLYIDEARSNKPVVLAD
jgi:hypothetical protein